MSKIANPRKVATNEAFATARGVRGSVQKAQLVLALIRGKKVEKALNELTFCRQKMAEAAKKVLQSAIANAENNHQLNVDKLVVSRAFAEKGLVMKRWHARARGRGAPILKTHCHLTIVVGEPAEKPAKEAKQSKAKAAPKKEKAAPKAKPAKTEQSNESTEA